MKLSVSSYSFSQLLHSGEMKVTDCVRVAKEIGFDAVEFTGVTRDEAEAIRDESERLSMPVSNYTVGADFLQNDTEKEAERLYGEVEIARILGATGMRHDASYGVSREQRGFRRFEDFLPKMADGCRMVSEYAAQYGIRTMVENHGYFCQDSERVEKLVSAVSHTNFGLLVDMGNFTCVDEDPAVAVGRVAPYAFYVHAKDMFIRRGCMEDPGEGFMCTRAGNYLRCTITGHGDVPVKQCLSVLKNAGYNGYVSLEFEGIEPAMMAIRIGYQNLRRYLSEI